MARTNEYKSTGGSFDKLTDAISSIDELLKDVKRVDETREGNPEKERGFRDIIAELQKNIGSCVSDLKHSWYELNLDPLYIYSTEQVNMKEYVRHIKFIHPEYEHVWLTEGKGQNVAEQMIPFIDYGIKYHYEDKKLVVNNLLLETKLNLPDFKTSLKAAQMDLQILKEDAKRVELVSENGQAAHKKLTEMLQLYCDSQEINLEVIEEAIPFAETEAERALRLKKEQEEAEKAAKEAEKAAREAEKAAAKAAKEAEKEAERAAKEAEREAERTAKAEARKTEEAAREKQRHEDKERKKKQEAARAVKEARAAAAQKRTATASPAHQRESTAPPRASAAPPPPPMGGRVSASPPPPPPAAMRKAGS